ncbi:restriction endonuclease [Streptomyces albidoflavus]|uniref:restriction endonuclease n=1 Tax=Streptomyces albidoflavus TaxID=1886 RepID=UPI001A91A030|nr:restriction endonuclease [Streptomyces albidoflavus]
MELEELLRAMDRAAANLKKLEKVWEQAEPFIPTSARLGSDVRYDRLKAAWMDLLPGLPEIDGWTITEPLPSIEDMGQAFLDYLDIGFPPTEVHAAGEKPGADIATYRYRLERARRRAVRDRLKQLVSAVDAAIPLATKDAPQDPLERVENERTREIEASVGEIARLLGESAESIDRWWDLQRHMRFSQGQDWRDITAFDWPAVRTGIEAKSLGDSDPLPVPEIDLGRAASGDLTGSATLALPWDRLDDDGFERLIFDLLRAIPEHQNIEWLMQTRAPDRGRDLSMERVLHDGSGGVRTERVIVQAKHWLSRSVPANSVMETIVAGKQWNSSRVNTVIVITSGRFTSDAVSLAEGHNADGIPPHVELWAESRLEMLLAQRPHIAAAHGLK